MKFNILKIEDVCDFVGGSQPPKSQFVYEPKPGYVRLIQTRDYKTDAFPTYIPKLSTKKFCNESDIMIGRYGPPIFQICRGLKGAYNVALLKVVPKEGISPEFLYYFLKQNSVFQYVDKLSTRTGGQTGVDLVSLNKYPIRIPENIENQRKLVTILSVIDKKIDINNKINTELEAMAKTLYEYWFVQFDFPDVNGKPYKTSGGKMVYNPILKRKIPENWDNCRLNELIKLEYGKPLKSEDRTGSGYPVFGSSGIVGYHNDYLVKGPGIIIGRKGTVGKVNFAFDNFHPIDTSYYVSSKKEISMIFLYYLISSLGLERMNSDSAVPGLNREAALGLSIVSAPLELISKYHKYAEVWFEKKKSIVEENNTLIKLRDWLLPMLMNGKVTVR